MKKAQPLSLEQERAKNAWEAVAKARDSEEIVLDRYANFAKAMPALIMNSGLMQVLAFCHEKSAEAETVAQHLRSWLCYRFPTIVARDDFESVMNALLNAAPADYQAITVEAFAWLRWLRQMASARNE